MNDERVLFDEYLKLLLLRVRVGKQMFELSRSSPDFSPDLAVQMSCGKNWLFKIAFARARFALPRTLPCKSPEWPEVALIRDAETFSVGFVR